MIELIIVLLLISILVTIGVTYYKKNLNSAFDTEKKTMVSKIEKVLISEAISNGSDLVLYTDKSELLSLLEKRGIVVNKNIKHYHYFTTENSFAIATCLSNNEKFYKGDFEPSVNCSNLLAQSVDSNTGDLNHIEF